MKLHLYILEWWIYRFQVRESSVTSVNTQVQTRVTIPLAITWKPAPVNHAAKHMPRKVVSATFLCVSYARSVNLMLLLRSSAFTTKTITYYPAIVWRVFCVERGWGEIATYVETAHLNMLVSYFFNQVYVHFIVTRTSWPMNNSSSNIRNKKYNCPFEPMHRGQRGLSPGNSCQSIILFYWSPAVPSDMYVCTLVYINVCSHKYK